MKIQIKEMQKIIETEMNYSIVGIILSGLATLVGIIFGIMHNKVWMFAIGLFFTLITYAYWKKIKNFEKYI